MRSLIGFLLVTLLAVSPVFAQQPPPTNPGQPAAPVIAPELGQRASGALEANDLDRALLDYSLFLLLNPTFSQAYVERAVVYVSRGEIDSALEDLDRALATSAEAPNFRASVYAIRARIFAQEERTEEALADYNESIELFPIADTYVGRAALYLGGGDLEGALADFSSAIDLSPEEPILHYYRGILNNQLGNGQAAAVDYLQFANLIEARTIEGDVPLTSGEAVGVRMDQGVIYRLPVEAEDGQRLSAVAQAQQGAQVDPLLVLLDPAGDPLVADDDGGGGTTALIRNYTVEETGTYTLLVTHSVGGATGDIAVRMELAGGS